MGDTSSTNGLSLIDAILIKSHHQRESSLCSFGWFTRLHIKSLLDCIGFDKITWNGNEYQQQRAVTTRLREVLYWNRKLLLNGEQAEADSSPSPSSRLKIAAFDSSLRLLSCFKSSAPPMALVSGSLECAVSIWESSAPTHQWLPASLRAPLSFNTYHHWSLSRTKTTV